MSKERQRARATREAQRAAERAKAARKRERREQMGKLKPSMPESKRQPVYRQRRYPPLPVRWKVSLLVIWVAVQVAAFFLTEHWGQRIAIALVSLGALPLIVVLVRDPARRTKR